MIGTNFIILISLGINFIILALTDSMYISNLDAILKKIISSLSFSKSDHAYFIT